MGCLGNYTLQGIGLDCQSNVGGIKRVWLGFQDSFTVTESTSAKRTVDQFTAEDGAKLYQYDLAKNTGSFDTAMTKNEENNSRYYTSTLSLSFSRMEAAKHLEVEALAAEALIGIVEDNNGKFWLVGNEGYLSANETTATTEGSWDGRNGYTVTMTAESSKMPLEIEKSKFESYIESTQISD